MKKDYYLLDWDGCLAKTLDIWLNIYKRVVSKRGIEVKNTLDFVEKTFGKWEKGFENVGVSDSVEAYKEALQEVEEEMSRVELYPNAEQLLLKLKAKGKKIALLTSSFRHLVVPALKRYHLDDVFDYVITKDETIVGKPDPWIVNEAISHFRGNKESAVIVGDSDHDILTGHNSGITTILYYPEHNKIFYRREFLMNHNPDYVVTDLLEILKLFDLEN